MFILLWMSKYLSRATEQNEFNLQNYAHFLVVAKFDFHWGYISSPHYKHVICSPATEITDDS